MNRKALEKQLENMGYRLRKTEDSQARWMVISNVLTYHWDFKDLRGVQRFMVDERAMYRYARQQQGVTVRK